MFAHTIDRIDQLKEFGVTVYLADHDGVDLKLLRQVVRHAASRSDRSKHNQRCFLYRYEVHLVP